MTENKVYLGDGAYAEFQGYAIRIFTSDGISDTNEVWVEPDLLKRLVEFAKAKGWKL